MIFFFFFFSNLDSYNRDAIPIGQIWPKYLNRVYAHVRLKNKLGYYHTSGYSTGKCEFFG